MHKQHHYAINIRWKGNTGTGTSAYKAYERSHVISANNKADIQASSDPAFRGDPLKYSPEELLLASASSCHMLWYLHLCSSQGIIVVDYEDNPTAIMTEDETGNGRFTQITLRPSITVKSGDMIEKAETLHAKANKFCYIANTLNIPVHHEATYLVAET
jgi:organic hydroperoxide reductase OsmC/OhrA